MNPHRSRRVLLAGIVAAAALLLLGWGVLRRLSPTSPPPALRDGPPSAPAAPPLSARGPDSTSPVPTPSSAGPTTPGAYRSDNSVLVRVVDPQSRPIAGAEVFLQYLHPGRASGGYHERIQGGKSLDRLRTGADGTARLVSLMGTDRHPRLRVHAAADGWTRGETEIANPPPGASAEVTITLSTGGAIEGRLLGLVPGTAGFVSIQIRSRVDDSLQIVQPDEGGAFRCATLPPGGVALSISSLSDYYLAKEVPASTGDPSLQIPLDRNARVGALRVRPGTPAALADSLIDFVCVGGDPLASEAPSFQVRAGRAVVRPVPVGMYTVYLTASSARKEPGGFAAAEHVSVTGEGVLTLEPELRPAGRLTLTAAAAGGVPVLGACFVTWVESGPDGKDLAVRTWKLEPNGVVDLEGLPPGLRRFKVTGDRIQPQTFAQTVVSGSQTAAVALQPK